MRKTYINLFEEQSKLNANGFYGLTEKNKLTVWPRGGSSAVSSHTNSAKVTRLSLWLSAFWEDNRLLIPSLTEKPCVFKDQVPLVLICEHRDLSAPYRCIVGTAENKAVL